LNLGEESGRPHETIDPFTQSGSDPPDAANSGFQIGGHDAELMKEVTHES
jgi:hypothetical protein